MNAPACRAVRTCERLHGGSRHPFPRSDAQPRVAQTDGPWPTAPSVCPLEGHLPLLPPVPTDAPSHLGLKPPEKPGTSRDLLGGSSTQSRSERSWPKTDTGVRAPGPFFLRTQESWPQTLLSQPGRN
ncbi:Inactive Rhomboid Protein 1 [Manis pentadactyla]|nr:Inactive Rhomboid Protein 1 [Manis pentadactyla]